MNYKSDSMEPECIYSYGGTSIFMISCSKFKTNSISFFFMDDLCRERAAKNALVPAVLRRGTQRHPTQRELTLHLQELYGASFDCGVSKKGETHVIYFSVEFIPDKYTAKSESLGKNVFDMLWDIIFDPFLKDNNFKEEYFLQEKENLSWLIESRINDKVSYAVDRCYEEMCKGEPFGVYVYGSRDDLEQISNTDLFNHYDKMIHTLPLNIYITGNLDGETTEYITEKVKSGRKHCQPYKHKKPGADYLSADTVNYVTEKQDITQGKLTLGFRTDIWAGHPDYYRLLLYNAVLGGGINSKLFKNIRERSGLAYYIFSTIEKFKGLMVISCGIETGKRNQVENMIMEQLNEINNGKISDEEFTTTMKTVKSGIRSLKDDHRQIVDFYLSQFIAGTNDSLDMLTYKLESVKKDEISGISGKIKLDTVYFLEGQ